jgi:isopenicillin N synthase-like dioxygenase
VPGVPVIAVRQLRRDPDSAAARSCIQEMDAACRATGFFVAVEHGVERQLEEVFAAARRFFALPRAEKERSAMVGLNGYAGPESRRAAGTEMLDIGLTGFDRWPALAGFREVVERYQAAALAVATDILRGLAIALDAGSTFFAERMRSPQCFLRMLRYPADPGSSAGAHTDYGAITLLATDGVRGLQLRPVDGEWTPIDAPAGSLIVNLGDMLARWTNGLYQSTPHRVVIDAGVDRYSIPFFVNPDPETEVSCIPSCVSAAAPCAYEPITAGEFLQGRIDGTIPVGA